MAYIIIILLAVIILVFVVIDGSFLPKKYNKAYKTDYYEDDLHNMIDYAIGASSGHNMQPWLVKIIDENTIELYADMDKQLNVVDAANTQMLVGQGAFIQKFKQGAEYYGYNAEVQYADIDLSTQIPLIARIKVENISDVLVDTVTMSTVNAAEVDSQIDLKSEIGIILEGYDGFTYEYITSGDEFDSLQNMLLEGTIAESKDTAAMEELVDIFRFTEWQKNKYRYGLSLNSLPNIIKPFVQPIIKMSAKNVQSFGESSIKMYEDRLNGDVGYILIIKDNPQNIDFIYLGEIYQELIGRSTGYSIRPSMQLLEEFDAMMDLNKQFKAEFEDDGEVLIILNVQESEKKSASNPRQMAEDIIID